MLKYVFALALVFLQTSVYAAVVPLQDSVQVRYYILNNGGSLEASKDQYRVVQSAPGQLSLVGWAVPGIPQPTGLDYDTVADSRVADLPLKYRKFVGSKWVEKTPAEKVAADAAEWAAMQLAKPVDRKLQENSYLSICNTALDETGSPTNNPPIKMTLDDMSTLLETLPGNKEQKFGKLLSKAMLIGDNLSKYDVKWYDTVEWHP